MRSGSHRAAVVLLAASFGCATAHDEHATFVEKLAQWRGRDVGELFHAVGKPMRTFEAANGNPVVVYEINTVVGDTPYYSTGAGMPYYPTARNGTRLCR